MLLIYFAVAWTLGIATASFILLPIELWAWWLVLPMGLLVIWRRDSILRIVHICFLIFLLGAMRYTIALPPSDWQETDLAFYNERGSMLLIGDVIHPPEQRDRTTHIRLSVTRVRAENIWHDVTGLALVQAPRETDARYGDQLQLFAEPQTPPVFDDFSYKDYLARQGIHSLVRFYGNVRILARDQGNPFFAALYDFRDRAHRTITTIFPEPAASLLAGILLGIESGIPRDVRDAFSATNTAHIIAISGFNISIIAGILLQLTRRIVGAKRATFIVILGLAIYTLLVGASPSVVRAAIMGSLTVIALHVNRPNAASNALAIAAFAMLVHNPFALFDVGFQLSFLATLGLILYVTPLTAWFENFLARVTSNERAQQIVGGLNDSFIVTLAAQITTTPLIVFTFHRLSLVGLLANFIILPAQPPVMILGGIATLVAMIFQPLGQLIAWIAWAFLQFTISVVQFTASLPFASIDVGRLDVVIPLAYYALLIIFTLWHRPETPSPVRAANGRGKGISVAPAFFTGTMLIAGIWFWNLIGVLPDRKTHIEFLDAGGAATFVRTPNGTRILIDGGANPSATLSALGQRMPFWDRVIDLLVLTDVDDEHLAGAVAAVERFDVRQIVQTNATSKTATFSKWRELVMQKNISSITAHAGLQIELDRGVALEFFTPSLARLHAGTTTILFADGVSVDEQSDFALDEMASAVLVTPRKIDPDFFAAVNPHLTILFVGAGERTKPSTETLTLLANTTLLRTDEHGAIEVVIDGQTFAVKSTK